MKIRRREYGGEEGMMSDLFVLPVYESDYCV